MYFCLWGLINQAIIQEPRIPTVFICLSNFCCSIFQDRPICSTLLVIASARGRLAGPKVKHFGTRKGFPKPFSWSVSFSRWGCLMSMSKRLCLRGQMTPSESEDELVAEQELAPLSLWWHFPLPGTVCVPKLLCFNQWWYDDNDRGCSESVNCQHLLSACCMPGTALKCFIWTPSNLKQPPACMWMSRGQNREQCLILGSCSNVCWKDEWPQEVGTVITSLFDEWGNRGTQRWVTFQRFHLWLEASFKHSGTQARALQPLHYTSSTLCTKSEAHIVPFDLFALSPFYRSGSQSPPEPTFDFRSVRHPNPMFSSQHHLTLLLISMLKSLCAPFNWR